MSDKIIINAISKMYFIILSLLGFIFLTFILLFTLFQNGLHINKLSILNLQVKQLYIKWDEKIDVSLRELVILPSQEPSAPNIDYKSVNNSLKALQHTTDWFSSIVVEHIRINNLDISFKYKQKSRGFIKVNGPSIKISSSIQASEDLLKINITKLEDEARKINISGDIYLDLNAHEIYNNLNCSINDDANLTFYSATNADEMQFNIKSNALIKDIKYLIKLASLPKEIKFWTQDAIELEGMQIEILKGKIDFHAIENAYKNIYVKAKANKLIYTYNTQLDGIHTEFTNLEFKDGVLYIRPKKAFSYKNFLGESWLKIDFTLPEEVLTLHLLFDGQLNKGMLNVLKAYKIDLPFLQRSGTMSTDMQLVVNLINIDVDAKGVFTTKAANFDYLGLNIDIFDTKVLLDNYYVNIEKMRARYKDIAQADVKVEYNAKTSKGKIDFEFDSVKLAAVKLNSSNAKLNASYIISPEQDMISVEKSTWNLNGHLLDIDSLAMPFNLETLNVTLPTTFLELKGIASAFIAGEINLKNFKTDLDLDILNLSYDGITLSQSNTPLKITYDTKFSILASDDLYFNISGTEYMLEKPIVLLDKKNLTLKNTKLAIGRYVKTKIYAKHNLEASKTHVSLSDFFITNYNQDKTLYHKKKILLAIESNKEFVKINSKELDASFISTDEGWKIYVNSLARIATNSEILKKIHIDKGDFTLYKKKDDKYVKFNSKITYPYKVLTYNNRPTDKYTIDGKIKNDTLVFNVNKNTRVSISDTIKIKTKQTGINIDEVIKAIKEFETDDKESKKLDVRFKALDSYLYISDSRKVISELIKLQYTNDILSAQLNHHKGRAGLRLQGNQFHLYGKEFDGMFMEKLFSLSKFKGGKLDFSMEGTLGEYDGVFYITDSTIIDYKILNNILAFINTVPSLVTFSLPGYNDNGLYVKQSYLKFKSKEDAFNLSDIYLQSKELQILGNGNANLKKDSIDIKLNLKTDLGSNASKIPLVGYIFFDEETVSTTLKITGKLSDPTIESLLARDIVVAPLNIIKRTLTLPYDMLKNLQPDANKTK